MENTSLTKGHKDYFDDSHESFGALTFFNFLMFVAGAVCVWLVFVIGVSISKSESSENAVPPNIPEKSLTRLRNPEYFCFGDLTVFRTCFFHLKYIRI